MSHSAASEMDSVIGNFEVNVAFAQLDDNDAEKKNRATKIMTTLQPLSHLPRQ
jgi:hypothetical protein